MTDDDMPHDDLPRSNVTDQVSNLADPSIEDELAIRKALGAVSDLEPPRDDLFVDRAVSRGRAKANRGSRPLLIAAASAGVLLVGGFVVSQVINSGSFDSPTASSAREAAAPNAPSADGAGGATDVQGRATGGAAAGAPDDMSTTGPTSIPTASGLSTQPSGAVTTEPQIATGAEVFLVPFDGTPAVRQRVDAALSELLESHRDTFAGAWANQDASVTIALTTLDPAVETTVRSLAGPSVPISFVTGKRTLVAQAALAQRVVTDRATWATRGVEIFGVTNDPRTQQVIVNSSPAIPQSDLDAAYGPATARAG